MSEKEEHQAQPSATSTADQLTPAPVKQRAAWKENETHVLPTNNLTIVSQKTQDLGYPFLTRRIGLYRVYGDGLPGSSGPGKCNSGLSSQTQDSFPRPSSQPHCPQSLHNWEMDISTVGSERKSDSVSSVIRKSDPTSSSYLLSGAAYGSSLFDSGATKSLTVPQAITIIRKTIRPHREEADPLCFHRHLPHRLGTMWCFPDYGYARCIPSNPRHWWWWHHHAH